MIVVSDTTALTTLMKCGLEQLLPALYSEVLVPQAVARELLDFHAALPAWCIVRETADSQLLDDLRATIDPGEAEAIALALELHADLVLLDDKKGRRQADRLRGSARRARRRQTCGTHCLAGRDLRHTRKQRPLRRI